MIHFNGVILLNQYFLKKINLGWINTGDRSFCDITRRYKIYIFCTPLPSKDINNSKKVDFWRLKFMEIGVEVDNKTEIESKVNTDYDVEKIKQTSYDRKFIMQFYNNLENLFDVVDKNGFITCFSFAVFNTKTNRSSINNYKMFEEIKYHFNKNKRLLAEWLFTENNFYVYKYKSMEMISYSIKHDKHLMLLENEICIT